MADARHKDPRPFAEFSARSATSRKGSRGVEGSASKWPRVAAAQEELAKDPSSVEKLVSFFTAAVTERHEADEKVVAGRTAEYQETAWRL